LRSKAIFVVIADEDVAHYVFLPSRLIAIFQDKIDAFGFITFPPAVSRASRRRQQARDAFVQLSFGWR
jgi:hypothetical protein